MSRDSTSSDAVARVGDFDEAAVLTALTQALASATPAWPGTLGIGDDCAVLTTPAGTELLATTDALVAGTHFDGRWADPRSVGRKALAVNVSDIAAMGGRPRSALLALTLPAALSWAWLLEFAEAFGRAAEAARIDVVGGNLARGPVFSATVTLLGEVDAGAAKTRAGAQPGDRVLVTGALGGACVGLRMLTAAFAGGDACADICDDDARWSEVRAFAAREDAVRAQLTPEARVSWGQAIAPYASAMMDLSDGLVPDAARLAAASGVRLVVALPRVPRVAQASVEDALTGGEDYELLLTVHSGSVDALFQIAARDGIALHEIGVVTTGQGVWLDAGAGPAQPAVAAGFEHFRQPGGPRGSRA